MDLHYQFAFIVLHCDDSSRHVVNFSSKKSTRIVRLVLGGELYASADVFDYSYTLKRSLQSILATGIPVHALTDYKPLFDVIKKCSNTNQNRLMINIRRVTKAYKVEKTSNIGLIWSERNPTDPFTKRKLIQL